MGLTSKNGEDLLVPFANRIGAKTYLDAEDFPMRNVAWSDVKKLIDDHVAGGGSLHINVAGVDNVSAAAKGAGSYGSWTERELHYICSTPALLAVTTFHGGAAPC